MYLCTLKVNISELPMGERIKKLKKIRIHREGTSELLYGGLIILAVNLLMWYILGAIHPLARHFVMPITCGIGVFVWLSMEENEYFHDKRLMISIFMSPLNVHANWFPVDGKVKFVHHQNGNYHKAWLPKASEENEHADVMITTPDGEDVLVRQIAGAMARRIVTYAKEGEECYIDEHMGFIKLGSRVDVYLPLTAKACVTMGQPTTGDQTVIAKLA